MNLQINNRTARQCSSHLPGIFSFMFSISQFVFARVAFFFAYDIEPATYRAKDLISGTRIIDGVFESCILLHRISNPIVIIRQTRFFTYKHDLLCFLVANVNFYHLDMAGLIFQEKSRSVWFRDIRRPLRSFHRAEPFSAVTYFFQPKNRLQFRQSYKKNTNAFPFLWFHNITRKKASQ